MPVKKTSVSLEEGVFDLLEKQSEDEYSRSYIIGRDLKRYYKAIADTIVLWDKDFTENEMFAIFASCSGTTFNTIFQRQLPAQVQEAHRYGELRGIDGISDEQADELIRKLLKLSYFENIAYIHLAERYWLEVKKGRIQITPTELIQEVLEEIRGLGL